MSNSDDQLPQQTQGDPSQRQPSQLPDQDLAPGPAGEYGLAGQGTMGEAMSRDVDPNLTQGTDQSPQDPSQQSGGLSGWGSQDPNAPQSGQQPDQWGQDPNAQQSLPGQQGQQANQWTPDPTQQGGMPGQDPFQQQSGQMGQQGTRWSQDPSQQQGGLGQQSGQPGQDPSQQQGGQLGQDPYGTSAQGGIGQPMMPGDQDMTAGGYGGNQPDLAQTNLPGVQNQPTQQNVTPAQGAPVWPIPPGGQSTPGDEGMLGSTPDEQRSSGGGLGGMLGRLFGRQDDEAPRDNTGDPNQ